MTKSEKASGDAQFGALAEYVPSVSNTPSLPEGDWTPGQVAILAGLRQTKYRVKSAWSGHLPFAFAIVALHRPRRLVELGTHRGASFFAFCEAMKEFEVDGECLAVDHWLGDPQAGAMDEQVYEAVRRVLDKDFPTFASTLRMSFEDAAPLFEDGSVDLLHIDGFHTYGAVATDYSTWLPKLSSRGVVLFHDINEHKESFGVWRLWSELSRANPGRSFAFGHSHGLGVLSLDTDPESPVNRFLADASSTDDGMFFQQYFLSASLSQERARIVTSRAIEQERVRSSESRLPAGEAEKLSGNMSDPESTNEAASDAGLEALARQHRQEIEHLRASHAATLEALHSSRSWKLTAPFRWASRGFKKPPR